MKRRPPRSLSPLVRGLFLLLVGALVASVAIAQQPQDATGKKLEAIRAQMEKGQALYVVGNYTAAAQVFESGYRSYPYSAFLFNAGVCHQKLNDSARALEAFREYLKVDPNAPDRQKVGERMAQLEAALASQAQAQAQPQVQAGVADGGTDADAGTPDASTLPPPPASAAPPPSVEEQAGMKSLVVIETEPSGAPLRLYARVDPSAAAFRLGATNPGWSEVLATPSPANLTLDVGRYHIVVEKFLDFNSSESDIDVSAGHVHHFKANLSQGEFMAFLRVSANVPGAHLYIDDQNKQRAPWGFAPHGELVSSGKHALLVEAPGFEPSTTSVTLQHGEQREMEVKLVRVGYGILRIASNAPAIRVKIDDQPRGAWRSGEAPLDLQLAAGRHRLTVASDGRKTFEGTVEVPRGQTLPIHVRMIPRYPRGAAWTQAVIGAAVIGASVYVGLESNRLHDELKSDRAAFVLDGDDSRATRGRWFSIGADVGFALGGVLGVLATYNFIKDPLPDSSLKLEKPLEFEDPLKRRPVAKLQLPRAASEERASGRAPTRPRIAPALSGSGLSLGGQF